MNICSLKAFAAFEPVSKKNKVECLVNFDGPQPVQPIDFNGAQPIQPIEFKEKQPVYFEEAQHVIVDESAADKILNLLNSVASVVVADDKSVESALRITNNGSALEISNNSGGVSSEVTIVGSKINVPVEIRSPLPLPTTGDGVVTNTNGDQFLGRAFTNFSVTQFGFISVASQWFNFKTGQNATGAVETLPAALIRLGLCGSNGKAVKAFYLRYSANHCGYTAGATNSTTTRPIVMNWTSSVDLEEVTLRCDVGVDPFTLLSPTSGQLFVSLWRNQNDLYKRNTVCINVDIFTRL